MIKKKKHIYTQSPLNTVVYKPQEGFTISQSNTCINKNSRNPEMARDSCLARVTAGVAVGGAIGGAVGKFSHHKP